MSLKFYQHGTNDYRMCLYGFKFYLLHFCMGYTGIVDEK